MAFDIRKISEEIAFALVAANNQRQTDSIGTDYFHADVTSTTSSSDYTAPTRSNLQVSAADGTNLATSLTLVNQIKDVVDLHFADAIAHDTAVSSAITIADGTDLATAVTLANDLKAKYNTHLSASGVHFNDDATNDVTNADATDQTTLNTLINEIKDDVNAHVIGAPPGAWIKLISA